MSCFHWSQKIEQEANEPSSFYYKGLTFPRYNGKLSRDEKRSGYIFYAYFGGKPMSRKAIEYQVDAMIERGLYQFAAA